MPYRSRRNPIIAACVAITVVYFLFFYPFAEVTDFRKNTEAGLARKHSIMQGSISDEALTAQTNRKLQDVLDKVKEKSETGGQGVNGEKPMNPSSKEGMTYGSTSNEDEDEVSVAGRKTMPKNSQKSSGKEKPKYPVDKSSKYGDNEEEASNNNKIQTASDSGEDMAREELQSILKKSPIIIFSKSYCRFSKRAKSLLLDTYTITPKPFVVELDLMNDEVSGHKSKSHSTSDDDNDEQPPVTLGRKLQDLLGVLTGRKTVPNIMINSRSLGGSDELVQLDVEGKLIEEIKRLGGNRIVSIEKKKEKD